MSGLSESGARRGLAALAIQRPVGTLAQDAVDAAMPLLDMAFDAGIDLAVPALVRTLTDVGVAGIHRILGATEPLSSAAVIIVVAGMEGALPSVVGGLVAVPVIAVPTSVGYGAAFGGLAALLGMLNSCTPQVVVVNIDKPVAAITPAYSGYRREPMTPAMSTREVPIRAQ